MPPATSSITGPAARTKTAPRAAHTQVGPLSVFNGDLTGTVDLLLASIRSGRGARVATANLDFVVRARRDDTLRADLAECSMVVADGAPVAWLARIAGGRGTRRVAGVDLVWELAARAHELGGLRFAIYGSEPHILAAAKAHIEAENPGAQIVATMSPPFRSLSEDEVAGDVAALAASRPDVVLIALGCPRQERFIAEHAAAIPGAVWIGVGGTFDFFAGKRRRAPRFLQAIGAEWLARLAQEPRRLWRRYLVDDLPTLVAVAPSCVRQSTRTTPSDVSSLRRALTGADS